MADVAALFAEYAGAVARGEHPDAGQYLARAGEGADELAGLLARFVVAAPAREGGEVAQIALEAMLAGEPPLLELRKARGLRRDEVVDALVAALGLDAAKREQVKLRFHELETGLVEPARVDRRVWAALGTVLRAAADELAALRVTVAPPPAGAFYRAEAPMSAPPASPPVEDEPDEVDRLFGRA